MKLTEKKWVKKTTTTELVSKAFHLYRLWVVKLPTWYIRIFQLRNETRTTLENILHTKRHREKAKEKSRDESKDDVLIRLCDLWDCFCWKQNGVTSVDFIRKLSRCVSQMLRASNQSCFPLWENSQANKLYTIQEVLLSRFSVYRRSIIISRWLFLSKLEKNHSVLHFVFKSWFSFLVN